MHLTVWLAAEDQPVFDALYVRQTVVQCNIFLLRVLNKWRSIRLIGQQFDLGHISMLTGVRVCILARFALAAISRLNKSWKYIAVARRGGVEEDIRGHQRPGQRQPLERAAARQSDIGLPMRERSTRQIDVNLVER